VAWQLLATRGKNVEREEIFSSRKYETFNADAGAGNCPRDEPEP
jgi:hypothetical protein